MIDRFMYYNRIKPFVNKPLIKILTGVRRSGKSTFMKLIQEDLIKDGIQLEQIIYINFESMRYFGIRTSIALYEHVSQLIKNNSKYYLFFDEIQVVDHWEEAVNSFLVDFDVDIYITGSNSNMLSSELSTLLTGRYVSFKIHPLSFKEVIKFNLELGLEDDVSIIEDKFIRQGGFPAIHTAYYDDASSYVIINDIYDSIVLRDVVERYKIRDIELLNRIMKYVIDNIGSTFSANSISKYFKSQYRKVDISTIYNYLEALVSSYILDKASRYDVHGKEILKTQEKYYLVDHGIQNAIFDFKLRNISGILENIVFNELKRRDYKVYVGKLNDLEIDFVAERKSEKLYIQVTYKMENQNTIDREFGPLILIKDQYPKYVLSLDEHYNDNYMGIKHMNVMKFIQSDLF